MSTTNRIRDVLLRMFAAVAVGAAVAGTAYLCAFYSMRNELAYRAVQEHTQHELDRIQKAVEEHRRDTGRLPASLTELKREEHFRLDADGQATDPWKHPYQYRVEGDGFALYSLGADGAVGGEGRDADIYPTSVGRSLQPPTLRQFTFVLPTPGVQWTCFLAGVCAGLVCLLPSRNRHRAGFIVRIGATAVGAILVAVVISALHIPSGH